MERNLSPRRRAYDLTMRSLVWLCTSLTCALLLFLIGFIFYRGFPGVTWDFLSGTSSYIKDTIGILPNILNTLYIVLLAMALVLPLGVGAAIYLTEYAANRRVVELIEFATETLTGIPSIIFGLVGMLFFVQKMDLQAGVLAGSLTLVVMILPTIVRTTQESLKTVPQSYREGALALGAGKWRMVRTVVLPNAVDGIVTGCILAVGRIVGESAALLYTAGFGLVLRGHATTGGSDMLASIVHRHVPALKVSVCLFATDATVVIASGFVFDAAAAMYALISVSVMNVVIDQVLEGPGLARSHIIITTHGNEIAERILKELDRGVTALDAKGMYSGEDRTMLLCVVSRLEAVRLRAVVFSVDPRAFVIVQNVHEALGEGFKELQK